MPEQDERTRTIGRPKGSGKFDAVAARRIIKAIKHGAPFKDAAQCAGVTYNTFVNWRNKGGREKSGPYFAFFKAVEAAESEMVEVLTARVHAASKKDWNAAKWLLQCHRSKVFFPIAKNKVEHTGENGAPIQTQNANLNVTPAQQNVHPDTIPAEVLPDQSAEDAVRKFFGLFPTYTPGPKPDASDDSDDGPESPDA